MKHLDLVESLRKDFPILNRTVKGYPLAYLDNAATTQKPQCVIDAIAEYYATNNANIHRGVHCLSEQSTEAYEGARQAVQQFINAKHKEECVFVRGTTEAINLVAYSFGQAFVKAGDAIVISEMEHHANIVPWQLLCERTGATLKVIPFKAGTSELDLSTLDSLLSPETKLVSIVHASNSLGTINPIETIIDKAHAKNIPVLIDGAQTVVHCPIDVQALDCDFFTISAHKAYGPSGIGVLYGKKALLDKMPPFQAGGDMIRQVSLENGTTFNDAPYKFEAGTPAIANAIAFGTTIDYLNKLDWDALLEYETNLRGYAEEQLSAIPGLQIIGQAAHKVGVVSFVMDGIHPHDIGTIADQHGVALRTGHHCTQPTMRYYDVPATARASFGIYNTPQEVDQLVKALNEAKRIFKQ